MKKSNKKNFSKNKPKFPSSKFILSVLIFLILLIFVFFFIEIGLFEKFFGPSTEVNFKIADDCGIILGNLMHQIKNSDDCTIRCQNECGLKELNYVNSSFSDIANPCYTCDCNCK